MLIEMDEWDGTKWVMVDPSTGGPDEFCADNDDDPEIVAAVADLVDGICDTIELGGGAALRVRLRAVR